MSQMPIDSCFARLSLPPKFTYKVLNILPQHIGQLESREMASLENNQVSFP